MAKLFEGQTLLLYKQRLRNMHGPNTVHVKGCEMALVTNHLIGEVACVRCGNGRYSRAGLSTKIRMFVRDRVYMYLGDEQDAARIAFILSRWPTALTNLEFPLPMIEYSKSEKVALCYDPVSKTAFDFFSASQRTRVHKRLMELAADKYAELGIGYIAFDAENKEIMSRVNTVETLSKLKSTLRQLLADGEGSPF